MTRKLPLAYPVGAMFKRIARSIEGFAPAMLFQLADEGLKTPFQQAVACLISIRTRDETSLAAAKRLLGEARTPQAMARLSADEIDQLIRPATFHRAKAAQISRIARIAAEEPLECVPEDRLRSLPGIGPKCANLVLGIACGKARIGVDIHVHRVTNRWGYVRASTPERTMAELEKKLPRRYWVEINRLLVPFGKHVCTGVLPKCSTCPVARYCARVGVSSHR